MILGYCRKSTEGQQEATLDEQRRVIMGWAMAKGASQFDVQVYVDSAVSGTIALQKRPEGARLYRDARKGDTVIAAKLDRLFRDALDAQECYRDFQTRGVDLVLFDMGMEPVTRDGMSKFFFQILSACADMERTRIAERMAEGRRAKIDRGGHAGGEAPYGFHIVGSGRDARLEETTDEQAVLKLVRENAHLRVGRLVRVLRDRGLKSRTGRALECTQVKRMLARETRNG